LSRARDLAKAGRKDEARDWTRFFQNSGILEILVEHKALMEHEAKLLADSLHELQGECHPLDVPNYQTDLQAIRGHLELIERRLGIVAEPVLKIAS
jgi:hypothetical protein